MRDSNCKKKPGVCLMVGGLLLIAAAFLLTGYNCPLPAKIDRKKVKKTE